MKKIVVLILAIINAYCEGVYAKPERTPKAAIIKEPELLTKATDLIAKEPVARVLELIAKEAEPAGKELEPASKVPSVIESEFTGKEVEPTEKKLKQAAKAPSGIESEFTGKEVEPTGKKLKQAEKTTDKKEALLTDKELKKNSKKSKEIIKKEPELSINETELIEKKPTKLTSYANIIEPLMPAVVNINTVKYSGTRQSKNNGFPELLPFEYFNEFCEQYNVPFSVRELYSSPRSTSLGSGFIIDEYGLIVTNHHVVSNSDEIHIKLSDNREAPAMIVGIDPKTDLALLKIDSTEKFPFVSFGNSTNSRVGDVVIAIGNPLGFGGTVTTGIISSKGRDLSNEVDELINDFIQTDAAINTGNSGGPLFNSEGEVIGVNTAIPNIAAGTGIGFAIPSNTVKDIIEQLKVNGKINRGRLDITIQEVTEELADALDLMQDSGVLIVGVKQGGSGDKAGLQHGDLIVECNQQKILDSRKLQLLIAETHIGESVKLSVIRHGEKIELNANIVEEALETSTIQGATFSNLSPNVISKFNLDENSKGIAIIEVQHKEMKSDLRVGDLVLALDHQEINDVEQFKTLYEKMKITKKTNVPLLVKRQEFKMFVALPIKQ